MSHAPTLSEESEPNHTESRPKSGDELLPPVEPPSAGFIVQLFVVPAIIVILIVAVWLTVSWLVHRTRPMDLVQGLEGTGVARWQRASELADILRNERFAEFKRNRAAASKLASNLKREIDAADQTSGMNPESVMLRFFLCRALGEFQVTDGMDVLLLAAETNRDPAEQLVRRGAIQAIAMRAFHQIEEAGSEPLADPRIEAALQRLAEDADPLIRSETAYALGRIGTPVCTQRLEVLVEDPHADTRYNAAVALARQGNPKAVSMLAEMLEPVPLPSILEEPNSQAQVKKRVTILHNALEAAKELRAKNSTADVRPLVDSLQMLVDASDATLEAALIPRAAISDAKRVLDLLRTNGANAESGSK
jgi:hypothetical protein